MVRRRRKGKYDPYAHRASGITTIKVSKITRDLLTQATVKLRDRDNDFYWRPDLNEVVFYLAHEILGPDAE